MRKILILLLLLSFMLVVFPAAAAPSATLPTATVIDDFESYTSEADDPNDNPLASTWVDEDDDPVQTLVNTSHAGVKAMQLDYVVTGAPVASVSRTFVTALDWSEMTKLTLWYQGFASNSADDIFLQLLDETNTVLFQDSIPGGAGQIGWRAWVLDLTQATEDLSAVDGIILGIAATTIGSPGSGSVLFDDISVSDGQENIWQGDDSTDPSAWSQAGNWSEDVAPDVEMDARIPSVPIGGNMPVINSAGASVHDLTIEAGATLDLGVQDLSVSGTIYNFGTITQTQAVGANAEVDFVIIGGHPGVKIVTGAAPAAMNPSSAEALGQTTVSIGGNQACTSGDNSVQRCYDISPEIDTALADGATVTFYFDPQELNGNECESLAVWHFTGGIWEQIVGSDSSQISHQCSVAPYSVTVTGMTTFSPVLLSAAQPVAISLQTFGVGQQFPFAALALVSGLFALASLTAVLVLRRRQVVS